MKQELTFLDKRKTKIKKRLRKIDEMAESINPNNNLYPIVITEKELNTAAQPLSVVIEKTLEKQKSNAISSLLHHVNYVKKMQRNSNLYPAADSSTNWTWSVEGWRSRSKLSNKLWVNDYIFPANFWK